MLRLVVLLTVCIRIVSCDYVTKLLGVQHCKDPVPPFARSRLVEDYVYLVRKGNHYLVSGNITFFDPCKECRWTVSVMKEIRGTKKQMMRIKEMNCKHIVMQVIHKLFGIPIDYKKCTTKLGTFVFNEMDINLVEQQIRLPFRNNGVYYYTYNMYTAEGTQACYEVKVSINLNRH